MDIPEELPLIAYRGEVQPQWIDLNGHMESMAYARLLHDATAALFRCAGISVGYVEQRGLSVFQREFHLSYEREVKLGDPIEVRSWLVGHDAKRVHHFHELYHTGENYRSAMIEYMSLHIDLTKRRTAPFPPDIAERWAALAAAFARTEPPAGIGARISLER